MRSRTLVLLAALICAVVSDALARTWTGRGGRLKIEAEYVDTVGNSVRLRKTNGEVMTVPLRLLSGADQQYIKELEQQAPEDPPDEDTTRTDSLELVAESFSIRGGQSKDFSARLSGPSDVAADVSWRGLVRELEVSFLGSDGRELGSQTMERTSAQAGSGTLRVEVRDEQATSLTIRIKNSSRRTALGKIKVSASLLEPPSPTESGMLQGKITSKSKPLAGATVIATSGETKRSTQTRTDGSYELALPAGSYSVFAGHDDYIGSHAKSVDVPPDGIRHNFELMPFVTNERLKLDRPEPTFELREPTVTDKIELDLKPLVELEIRPLSDALVVPLQAYHDIVAPDLSAVFVISSAGQRDFFLTRWSLVSPRRETARLDLKPYNNQAFLPFSAMAFHPVTGSLYVATSQKNSIEDLIAGDARYQYQLVLLELNPRDLRVIRAIESGPLIGWAGNTGFQAPEDPWHLLFSPGGNVAYVVGRHPKPGQPDIAGSLTAFFLGSNDAEFIGYIQDLADGDGGVDKTVEWNFYANRPLWIPGGSGLLLQSNRGRVVEAQLVGSGFWVVTARASLDRHALLGWIGDRLYLAGSGVRSVRKGSLGESPQYHCSLSSGGSRSLVLPSEKRIVFAHVEDGISTYDAVANTVSTPDASMIGPRQGAFREQLNGIYGGDGQGKVVLKVEKRELRGSSWKWRENRYRVYGISSAPGPGTHRFDFSIEKDKAKREHFKASSTGTATVKIITEDTEDLPLVKVWVKEAGEIKILGLNVYATRQFDVKLQKSTEYTLDVLCRKTKGFQGHVTIREH